MTKKYGRSQPEKKVRDDIRGFLQGRGWGVEITHGNKYQSGLPDLYVMHYDYGVRWIDAKVEGRYSFTNAQKITWSKWHYEYRVGIWIMTAGNQEQYDWLFAPPNWLDYWKPAYGRPQDWIDGPDLDKILREVEK